MKSLQEYILEWKDNMTVSFGSAKTGLWNKKYKPNFVILKGDNSGNCLAKVEQAEELVKHVHQATQEKFNLEPGEDFEILEIRSQPKSEFSVYLGLKKRANEVVKFIQKEAAKHLKCKELDWNGNWFMDLGLSGE